MNTLKHAVMVVVLAAGTGGLAEAHHSANSQFDTNQTLTFTGVLEKYTLANPHSYLYFIRMDNGKPQEWIFETIAPIALRRAGLSARDSFKIGTTYSLAYSPGLANPESGVMTAIKLSDGRIVGVSAKDNLDKGTKLLLDDKLGGAQSGQN